MRFANGQDEVLVLLHLMPFAVHHVESAAIHTIDEHILANPLLPDAMVMFCLGVVANVCDKQPLTKVVLLLQLHNCWRQHHRLLALKSVFLSDHTEVSICHIRLQNYYFPTNIVCKIRKCYTFCLLFFYTCQRNCPFYITCGNFLHQNLEVSEIVCIFACKKNDYYGQEDH